MRGKLRPEHEVRLQSDAKLLLWSVQAGSARAPTVSITRVISHQEGKVQGRHTGRRVGKGKVRNRSSPFGITEPS